MSVIVDLALFPMGKGESVSADVARAVKLIRGSGLKHQTHAMGTLIEGDLDSVMGLVHRCFGEMAATGDRVYMTIKADYREGPVGRLATKVRSLESKLG